MKNNTLYASDITYEFEKARIAGSNDNKILGDVKRDINSTYPEKLEYLDDFYDKDTGSSGTAFKDKDTGEVILAYTGTNFKSNLWNDGIKTDIGRIGLGLGDGHVNPARKFYEKIRAEYGDDIILTGHSLGGNLAQWIALYYNVQKTIIYNPAPLHISSDNIVDVLDKLTKDTIIRTFGSLEPAKFVSRQLQPIQEEYLEKIMKLEETFTGQVLRIQSESDLLTMVASALKGKYIGREYFLTNAGTHSLSEIIDSEDARKEIEKITNQILFQKVNIDIDGDGKIDVRLGELDLKRKNLLNDKASIASGEKIQLNPEVLKTLSNNIQTRVLGDLETIKRITKLCIEKNNKVGMDFNKRKEQVSESVREELNNAQIPLILDVLKDSIGEIIKNKDILESLQKTYELRMDQFPSDKKVLVDRVELDPTEYNRQLLRLRNESERLLNHCIKERADDMSSYFEKRPTILKSWQGIESSTKHLLEESDKTFEGDGLRTGKEDGISQSLKQVLEVAGKNIEELEKQLQNTAELTQGLAENFEEQDRWIGAKLQQGVFIGSNPVKNMPQSYKAYLERDEIFDDVKDVIQAFDKQVEKRSKEYANKVTQIMGESLSSFSKGLESWIKRVINLESIVKKVIGNYGKTVLLEEYIENSMITKEISTRIINWGKFKQLYPEAVIIGIEGVQEKVISNKSKIVQVIYTTESTKSNLSYLEPNLKKIIEEGVYKAFDLDEIVNSQKIVKSIIEKSQSEIKYVKEHIGTEGMSGEAIKALNQKLEEVNRSLEYYKMFIGDCFGDQK
ncbi:SA1320 family protein [Gemella morbillorum]|uniref:SA1320 family protein n=1 Tax=Gemella morbillorum TaxID=29391 RepID=UPI00356374DD